MYGGQPDYAQPPAYPGMQPTGGMYPGLPNGQQNYGVQPNYPGAQPSYPAAQPSYPGAQPNYPGSQPNYPAANSNYPTGPQPGYPQWGNAGFQQSASDGFSGTVVGPGPGYPNNAGGVGPSAPTCKCIQFDCYKCKALYLNISYNIFLVTKEEEANQSANYNARMLATQQNNGGYAPPPDMNVSYLNLKEEFRNCFRKN